HTEGAGGGHAPDVLAVNQHGCVIPSSTNPTNPFTPAALEEGVPMTMLAHMMSFELPEDVAFAESRIRPQSMSAEDFLHDMGAVSIFATDTQGMGRLAENAAKCFQLASIMKDRVGRLPEEKTAKADNERILRYLAKLTINPAIGAGIDAHVGSIEPGKMADLVLWPAASFGAKPAQVIKSGEIVWSTMGDGNGSHIGSEPMIHRPMWGALGTAKHRVGVTFASRLAVENGVAARLGVQKEILPISSVRALRKTDMLRNDAMPKIEVDPQTFDVRADGVQLYAHPVGQVPLNRRYFVR
ncbi:MAG: urease subunit alpha, partial [Pseudomonadota bacterium]